MYSPLKMLAITGWYILAAQQGVLKVGDAVEVTGRRQGPPQRWAA